MGSGEAAQKGTRGAAVSLCQYEKLNIKGVHAGFSTAVELHFEFGVWKISRFGCLTVK